ncbi:stage VI sporulation protein F [Aquibacillus salsiterrae]|uniref:Stage VI sporulation protein F n=1 Tax=Aquibacillus salsiterrae TaxID=2950439 RepID=A0A9X3WDP8_9BACI|nr:stage VI sporulation protein F [Aquibacillus salsiterrae]MDC3417962.1 stage VI sporulation protein F [Aquibacillus salsiterrae]
MDHHHPFIKNIEKKTGIDMRRMLKLGDTVKKSNLHDEKHLRKVVKQIGGIAGKRPSRQTEDKIVSLMMRRRMRNRRYM